MNENDRAQAWFEAEAEAWALVYNEARAEQACKHPRFFSNGSETICLDCDERWESRSRVDVERDCGY